MPQILEKINTPPNSVAAKAKLHALVLGKHEIYTSITVIRPSVREL